MGIKVRERRGTCAPALSRAPESRGFRSGRYGRSRSVAHEATLRVRARGSRESSKRLRFKAKPEEKKPSQGWCQCAAVPGTALMEGRDVSTSLFNRGRVPFQRVPQYPITQQLLSSPFAWVLLLSFIARESSCKPSAGPLC